MIAPVPTLRVTACNDRPLQPGGGYVLYWMIAHRRTRWSFALQHAVRRAQELGKPLLVLEALRCDYRWASDRLHRFAIEGMAENARRFEQAGVRYLPYVEPERGAGRGLLEALAARAALVVTDEFPCFFLPRMVAAAAQKVAVRMEQVDANGILPLRASEKAYPTAALFRRHFQKVGREHLAAFPLENPLARAKDLQGASVPREVSARWKMASKELLAGEASALAELPIDHAVPPTAMRGGSAAGEARMDAFLKDKLARYPDDRNHPDDQGASGLSPYLHFGHVGVHELVHRVLAGESWTAERLLPKPNGSREGWWGLSPAGEGFLDEAITWREVGYGFCFHRAHDYERFESLPEWARATLQKHAQDPRPEHYSRRQLEEARTHDEIWNAAQRELRREGRMHNYLRMLWGKKILQWTKDPEVALQTTIELNNRWALDGRNPNSYSGIFWTLGRFDRPWAPERPIFGTVRYMSSDSTRKKLHLKRYLATYGAEPSGE
ncbi:MAG: deoxyribodipyrimidine photolyase [Planctomycetes bacterium]|nr:deoxyribodipyrimidine photolyase [Planctomycetota bacterium]